MSKPLRFLGYALMAFGIMAFLGCLVIEVIEGRGGDLYKSYKGINFSPIGVLIFAASFPIFVILSKLSYWLSEKRKLMQLKRYVAQKGKARSKTKSKNIVTSKLT